MSSIKKQRDEILGSDKIDTAILREYTKIQCGISMFNPRVRDEGTNFLVTILQNVFKDPIDRYVAPEINSINILLKQEADIDRIRPHLNNILLRMRKLVNVYNQLIIKNQKNKIKSEKHFEDNKNLYKKYRYDQEHVQFPGISVKGSFDHLEKNVSELQKKSDELRDYYNGEYKSYSLNQLWYWTGGWFPRAYNWGADYKKMSDIYATFSQVHIGYLNTDIHSNKQRIDSAQKILELQLRCTEAVQVQDDSTNIEIYVDNLERQLSTFYERLGIVGN